MSKKYLAIYRLLLVLHKMEHLTWEEWKESSRWAYTKYDTGGESYE